MEESRLYDVIQNTFVRHNISMSRIIPDDVAKILMCTASFATNLTTLIRRMAHF